MVVLLETRGLRVYYMTPGNPVRAVDGVSFAIGEGELVALVGESGSGKSTLGLAIMRLLPHPGRIVGGKVVFRGRDLTSMGEDEMRGIRGREITMVFQDPLTSLDPLMRVGDQMVEVLVEKLGLGRGEAEARARKYLRLVGISEERFRDYPHQFSGGMRQRAMIAMAVSTEPSLVIADEPTTALDVVVQAQIMELFTRLKEELGVSILLITHDISLAMQYADKIGVMYAGKLVEFGPTGEVYDNPLHPYTRGLLTAVPNIELGDRALRYIPGTPPSLDNPPPGCRFHPRCPRRFEPCDSAEPPPREERPGHWVACHLYG